MTIARALAPLGLAALCVASAGCATFDLVRTGPGQTHAARAPEDVEVRGSMPPNRRYAVAGTFTYRDVRSSRQAFLRMLQQEAAEEGCDAVLLTGEDAESPRCMVYLD